MDYNLWQELILGSTKPFRTGANILAQNWGSALTGKDMSQSQNQGKFLKWLAGGITPEEQREISERPYLSALKSGAGMASTLAPFASQSLRVAQLANNPVTNKIAQLASQGALEGGMGGFGYSRQGKELEDTLTGALLGAGGEIGFEALRNRSFRKMLGEAGTYVDPTTGQRMYKGGIDISGDNDTTVGDMIKLDQIQTRWGGAGNNATELLEKIKKGGDDALDAEARYIGQAWDNMDEDLKRQAWNRLDEIFSQIGSSDLGRQVESLISRLRPPEGIIPFSRPTRGSMSYISKDLPNSPTGSIGNQILLDAEAVKYPSGKRIIDEEDMRENLRRIVEIINRS